MGFFLCINKVGNICIDTSNVFILTFATKDYSCMNLFHSFDIPFKIQDLSIKRSAADQAKTK